jgi:hypothetical protein
MIFALNDAFVLSALDGLSHTQLWQRQTDRNNPMLWVAGHVVQTRASVLGLLGSPFDTGWGSIFDRGATLGDARQYPLREEIERVGRQVGPLLHARLASVDEAALASPASMQLPFAKTLGDELAFFALHDAYHVGQLAFIRKGLGYPGLAG